MTGHGGAVEVLQATEVAQERPLAVGANGSDRHRRAPTGRGLDLFESNPHLTEFTADARSGSVFTHVPDDLGAHPESRRGQCQVGTLIRNSLESAATYDLLTPFRASPRHLEESRR